MFKAMLLVGVIGDCGPACPALLTPCDYRTLLIPRKQSPFIPVHTFADPCSSLGHSTMASAFLQLFRYDQQAPASVPLHLSFRLPRELHLVSF